MELVYKKGDLLQAMRDKEVDHIIHGCNSLGVMGSGIAKQIRDEYPKCFEVYKNGVLRLGWSSHYKDGEASIFNLITQSDFHPRTVRHCNYEALAVGLHDLNELYAGSHFGLPKIGAGLGGGDWNVIEAIIKSEMKDCKVTIYTLE